MGNVALEVKSSDPVGVYTSRALWSVLELVMGRRQGEAWLVWGDVHGVVEREDVAVVEDTGYDSGFVRCR